MKNSDSFNDISQLIPHHSTMALIDRLIEKGDDYLIASVDLSKPSLFKESDGRIPGYVGIEYMAQSVSAYSGATRLEKGEPIKLGFLLGARKYQTALSYFPKDETIIITVKAVMIDKEFGVFDCSITTQDNVIIASAQLKAIQPDDISQAF